MDCTEGLDQRDGRATELIGRAFLTAQLFQAGIEVAAPIRDRGVDLIAYIDLRADSFRARPIQVKASLHFRFVHDSKYEKFPDLLIAHVVFLSDFAETKVYAMDYESEHSICRSLGYLNSKLWMNPGRGSPRYFMTKKPPELTEALKPYLMTPERWLQYLRR